MKVVYARESLEKSIFLAGPTPRDTETESWRPEALKILETIGFDGKVFVPEDRNAKRSFEYDDQVQWEWSAINQATIVIFWVPREIKKMPAFVTNVEFGMLANSGKVLLGAPEEAAKMGYLKALAHRFNIPFYGTLEQLLHQAVTRAFRPYGRILP